MIDSFFGDHRFLSNFFPARVSFEGITYPTVEHAYQAAKTMDTVIREGIAQLHSPAAAKKIGRLLVLRPDWEQIKIGIMRSLVKQKFAADRGLANQLLATLPHELVEGNKWRDTFWGVCNGVGENWLGRLLMERREVLVEELWADLAPTT